MTSFDADGFPTDLNALYSRYTFEWNGDQPVRVTATFTGFGADHTVSIAPAYENGRLVSLASTCTGACVASTRHDAFTYNERGSLAAWSVTGYGHGGSYLYDANGRVTFVDDFRGKDEVQYGDGPCPTAFTHYPGTAMTVHYDSEGRLYDRFGITYNEAGYVVDFGGTGSAFRPLAYEPGESRGLDLWPGHFDGGYVYGFPVRGELFRLDGSCDSTMSSQPTILSLALAASLGEATPASGT